MKQSTLENRVYGRDWSFKAFRLYRSGLGGCFSVQTHKIFTSYDGFCQEAMTTRLVWWFQHEFIALLSKWWHLYYCMFSGDYCFVVWVDCYNSDIVKTWTTACPGKMFEKSRCLIFPPSAVFALFWLVMIAIYKTKRSLRVLKIWVYYNMLRWYYERNCLSKNNN